MSLTRLRTFLFLVISTEAKRSGEISNYSLNVISTEVYVVHEVEKSQSKNGTDFSVRAALLTRNDNVAVV